MSEFSCKVVEIDDVIDCPNSDRLSIVKIRGNDCISGKLEDGSHRYQTGDYVVYIPPGALLPEWLLKQLDFWKDGKGTLSGSQGNRVKEIKLRGVFSSGILFPVDRENTKNGVHKITTEIGNKYYISLGEDVKEYLGIEKYEPQIPVSMRGQVGSLHNYLKSYDIESITNYPDIFKDGDEVVVSEKLHGTLLAVHFIKDLPLDKQDDVFKLENGFAAITSKGMASKGLIQKNSSTNQDNLYIKIYKEYFETTGSANQIAKSYLDSFTYREGEEDQPITKIIIYGEIFGNGCQDLSYGFKIPTFRVFDVYVANANYGYYLHDYQLDQFCDLYNIPRVPILYRGLFSMEEMIRLRDGKTTFNNGFNIREGIVIRPMIESTQEYRGLSEGRKQLKMVSPDYLLRKGVVTEYQ